MKRSHRLAICLVCAAAFQVGFLSQDALAQTALDITIDNSGYAPQVARIQVGTVVTWTNIEGVHTTTSRDGLWDSGVLSVGDTFTYEFDTVGLFRYYDTIHDWPSGTIEVVHSLATIDITTDKKAYAAGDTIKVGVEIENPGAAVQAGIYIWSKGPGGQVTWLLRKTSVLLPAGFLFSDDDWFTTTLPVLPRGEYLFGAALVKVPEQVLIDLDRTDCLFGKAIQSDWSGGPGATDPTPLWEDEFEDATGTSFSSIAGQLSLSAAPRAQPIETEIAYDTGLLNSVTAGDLDGDGQKDVIVTNPVYDVYNRRGAIWWWDRQPDGTFVQHTVSDDFYGGHKANTADVDSDGDLDVLAAAYYGDDYGLGRDGRDAWFENLHGDGSEFKQHLVGNYFWGADHIDAGDFDGDGDLDALLWNSYLLIWMENLDGHGFSWNLHQLTYSLENLWAAAADVDSDGKLDIVACSEDLFSPANPQLVFYDVSQFGTSGELTSTILDGDPNPGWEAMLWEVDTPSNTSLTIEVRASNDETNLGLFQVVPQSGVDLGTLIDPDARYLQYRVTLTSSDPAASPILRDLVVEMGSGL